MNKSLSISKTIYYIFCLVLLLKTHACHCNPPTKESPTNIPPTPHKGYWHTGQPGKVLKITAYPQHPYKKELYERPYQIYRVMHDGSCGFRSFIPILFHEIIGTGKLDQWLSYMDQTVYKPSQQIISQVNDWTDTKDFIDPKYVNNTASSKLYEEFKSLLKKLDVKSAARPLQEAEIQLSVDFLRQCVFMQLIADYYPKDVDQITAINKLKENLKEKAGKNTGKLFDFWAYNNDFSIFNIPYGIMFDKFGTEKIHVLHYYFFKNNHMSSLTNSDYDLMKESPEDFALEGLEGLAQLDIMLYHRDNIFFEYMIPQRDKQP